MYNGPFGRMEIGAVVIAADPASSKVLVQTYDGDLWIYDVDSTVGGRLSTLRVGDEVILAFDDRIGGKRAIAMNVVAPGRRPMPPGILSVAAMLPVGVVFGAPATSPATTSGTGMAAGVPVGGGGVFVAGSGGTTSSAARPCSRARRDRPRLRHLLGPARGRGRAADGARPRDRPGDADVDGGWPRWAVRPGTGLGGGDPDAPPFSQGNFTPGTISPGVTTANPNAPGSPVVQGPFTPGTVAPGVSQQRGNAPPPAAGATNTGAAPAPDA